MSCDVLLQVLLEATSERHNFTKEISRFAEQRNVKITDLLVLVFYADRIAMLFRISVAMTFLSAFFLASFLDHHKHHLDREC